MRQKIEIVFEKEYEGEYHSLPFDDIPKNIPEGSRIMIIVDEGFYSENNSYDGTTRILITRERDMTPEELTEDKAFWAKKKEESRKQRYESYLELKKEFDI